MTPPTITPGLLMFRVARSSLDVSERAVMFTLLERVEPPAWFVRASMAEVAYRSRVSARTVRRTIPGLDVAGLVTVEAVPAESGGRVSMWTMKPDRIAALPKLTDRPSGTTALGQVAPSRCAIRHHRAVPYSTSDGDIEHQRRGHRAPATGTNSTSDAPYIRARVDPFSDPSPDSFSDPSRTGPPAPTDAPAREGGTDGPAGKVLWAIERKLQNGRLVPKQAQQILTLVEGSPGLMERLTEAADAEDAITSPVGFVRSFIARGGVPSRRRTRSDEHPSEDDMEAQMERFNARRARS